MASLTSGNAYGGKYASELIETAARIIAPGKGILAADESTGTIGKRVRLLMMFWGCPRCAVSRVLFQSCKAPMLLLFGVAIQKCYIKVQGYHLISRLKFLPFYSEIENGIEFDPDASDIFNTSIDLDCRDPK